MYVNKITPKEVEKIIKYCKKGCVDSILLVHKDREHIKIEPRGNRYHITLLSSGIEMFFFKMDVGSDGEFNIRGPEKSWIRIPDQYFCRLDCIRLLNMDGEALSYIEDRMIDALDLNCEVVGGKIRRRKII